MKKLIISATTIALIAGSALFATAEDHSDSEHTQKPGKHKRMGLPKDMDPNGDGVMTKDEYMAHAKKRFTAMDANGNGEVTKAEMKEHRKMQKEKRKAKKEEMAQREDKMFNEMDSNGDGQISKEEMQSHRKANMKGKHEDEE